MTGFRLASMVAIATATAAVLVCAFAASALAANVEVHWQDWNGKGYVDGGDAPSDFTPANVGNGTWQLLPTSTATPELAFIQTKNTASGDDEVYIDQLADSTFSRVFSAPTTFSAATTSADGQVQLFGSLNGEPQVGYIQLLGATTVEVHIDDWDGSAYVDGGDYTTGFSPADAGNGTWELLPTSTGAPELAFIKLRNTTGTGIGVHLEELSGSVYKDVLDAAPPNFGIADANNGVWSAFGSVAGQPQVGFIKLRNTSGPLVGVHLDSWTGKAYQDVLDTAVQLPITLADAGTWSLFGSVNGEPEVGFIQLPPPAPAAAPAPAPAPSPVQTTPVKQTLPKPHGRRHVKTLIHFKWKWNRRHTRLVKIWFNGLPKRSKITVACHGKGCPTVVSMSVRAKYRHALIRNLDGRRFRAGDRLSIKVSARHLVAERGRVKFRNGKKPLTRLV